MKKNDKLIVIAGVIVLIIASIGIYTYIPMKASGKNISIDSFSTITGQLKNTTPTAITVSNQNQFYPLIGTPLAVHYDATGTQTIVPLYVENLTSPSEDVVRIINDQIKIPVDLIIDDTKTPEQWSLDLAQRYWQHSKAALLIEDSQQGYELGVLAAPIAAYLSIPIIIIDPNSTQSLSALTDLGVEQSIVCGTHIRTVGNPYTITTAEDALDAQITVINNRFGSTNYLVLTNPLDAYPPRVLAQVNMTIGPKTMKTTSTTMLLSTVGGMLKGNNLTLGSFPIPQDYKYALVKFKGINMNPENADLLGDNVIFFVGPDLPDEPANLQKMELYAGGTNMGGVAIRDSTGKIIEDSTYTECVLYDRGGVRYNIQTSPTWVISKTGQVKAEVTIQKLDDSRYPMIPKLSSLAPYLAAYHQGLVFGRPEFAFAANDSTLYLGQTSPGYSLPRKNPRLVEASNTHVFNIHKEINALLANIAGIDLGPNDDSGSAALKELKEYYTNSPMYIALVGDGTMLPQYLYNSSIEPISIQDMGYFWGCGIPSDFIYSDIDPNPGDWSNHAPDLYSASTEKYPEQENVIGRITGWDTQDASALIDRTIFYDRIINGLGDWKDQAAVMLGGGNDFQEPLVRYKVLGEMLGIIKGHGEPMKLTTGASVINGQTMTHIVEGLGYDTTYIRENEAAYQGFSNEAIREMKTANILNRLLFSPRQLRTQIGADIVRGKEVQERLQSHLRQRPWEPASLQHDRRRDYEPWAGPAARHPPQDISAGRLHLRVRPGDVAGCPRLLQPP